MKIKVNYDLLQEIKVSKKGMSIPDVFRNREIQFLSVVAATSAYSIFLNNTTKEDFIKDIIFLSSITSVGAISGHFFLKSCKDIEMENAKTELFQLLVELSNLNVNTSLEKLQEAEVLETNYKFSFVDNKPILKQKKYINIPLTNGYEQCILQEHNIGYSDYEISAQEPEKKVVLKPAKSSI